MPPDEVQPVDTIEDLKLLEGIPVRPGTKIAALVMALCRPQGATSLQLILDTGWQPHTVRGAISGMLRKKIGLNVVLAHNESGERFYRITLVDIAGLIGLLKSKALGVTPLGNDIWKVDQAYFDKFKQAGTIHSANKKLFTASATVQ